MNWKLAGVLLALLVLAPLVVLALMSALSRRPDNLGVHDGRLAACPATPNCVCTQADDDHRIAPLAFTGSAAEAHARLKTVLASQPRTRIVTETPTYLHVECTSPLFRFVDDVEFLIDEKGSVIHFRSASRTGYSDLGANRARMEAIRQAFAQAGACGRE